MSNEDHQQGRHPEPPEHEGRRGHGDRPDLPDSFVQGGSYGYPQDFQDGSQQDYADHGQGYGQGGQEYGGWQPTQGSDYDGESTTFLQLPPDMSLDAAPLEAPGHGYVPPMIVPLTPLAPSAETQPGPGATGSWAVQQPQAEADGQSAAGGSAVPPPVRWPEPGERAADPQATGQWAFPEEPGPAASAASAQEMTGQWSIPIADGDLPEESGEFARSERPVADSPWAAADAPATLPGGAPAPWATLPGGAAAPWAQQGEEPPAGAVEPDAPAAAGAEAPEPSAPDPDASGSAAPESGTPEPGAAQDDASGTHPDDAPDGASADRAPAGNDEHPPSSYVLRVNGTERPVSDAWIGESLLYVLRERLGLAGAKDGCSQGECGACNVQVDGRLVASCLVPAATAAGTEVRTVEGLARDGEPSDVQRALAGCGAVQCGFCIPGMAMTVHDLLEGNHAPTELETRQALCGNLCRCSGYRGVLDAVGEVVAERAASAAAATAGDEAHTAGPVAAHEEVRIPHQAPPGAGSVQAHPHDGGMA